MKQDNIKQPSFFGEGAEFWIGQVVSTKAVFFE